MIKYTNEQLATIVALPTITILLVWTVAIFHKNRKHWGPYDIPIIAVLVLSIIRNLTVLSYVLVLALGNPDIFNLEYCSVIVWIFNSLHTFQASSLTTIAVIGLFSVKLHRKHQNLKLFLTPTHIIYHLFCLTTLCACVGVAAILAQTDKEVFFEIVSPVFEIGPCRFMPFNLDIKYNVFILVLHLFLAVISFVSFLIICYNFYQNKNDGFEYIKKSTSDLSDMSLANTLNMDNKKNYYDTYTIQKLNSQNMDTHFFEQPNSGHLQNGCCANRDINWNSDLSTTVSSTNSRKPCLGRQLRDREEQEPEFRTGLETIHPILIVCYLFYHLPLIVLCIYPRLIHPWPVAGIAVWLGLVQDLLIPIGLGIVDSRFCQWVSNVYRCSSKSVEEKLPHVGLDGKFRPFPSSQPQSLEVSNCDRTMRGFQAVEHRFPITNGSLYTSIDGRLPVVHNYRRNKGQRLQQENLSSNVTLHSSLLNRQEMIKSTQKFPSCTSCELDLCPSHSNLHHLTPSYINKQLNLLQQQSSNSIMNSQNMVCQNKQNQNLHLKEYGIQQKHSIPSIPLLDRSLFNRGREMFITKKVLPNRVSHSQESLDLLNENHDPYYHRNSDMGLNMIINNSARKSSRSLARLNRLRLSRSEDSLNDLEVREMMKMPVLNRQNLIRVDRAASSEKTDKTKEEISIQNGYSSSDDDYLTDINDTMLNNNTENYDSLSSRSRYSITTEANGDFEFFQNHDKSSKGDLDSNITIPSNNEFFIINNVNNRPVMTSCKPVDMSRNSSQVDVNKNFRITRSNSKRSLESLQAFIEVEHVDLKNNNSKAPLQRSNSTIEDRSQGRGGKKLLRSNSKTSDCSHQFNNIKQKIKSVEYLPNTNASTIFIEQMNDCNHYYQNDNKKGCRDSKCAGSVPDLKKVFISEYI